MTIPDFRQKWATEIGLVFIAFGGIEYCTYELLRDVPRDPIYTALSRQQLSTRIDVLLDVLRSRPEPEAKVASQHLERARVLAEDRNLIAHNPLGMDFYVSPDGRHTLREAIRSVRKQSKHISFSDLQTLRTDVQQLEKDLYAAHRSLKAAIASTK
jgi:hypothetical protein